MPKNSDLNIAIIGAGPAGIAAGRELLQQGFNQFTIIEKESAPGGTWQIHSYPGLACDVWAHSYTFSYRPNPDWSASFVEQPEIQAYLAQCASEFGLDPHIKLNTRVVSAHYQPGGKWRLETQGGEQLEFDIVINAMGNQHTPLFPKVPGIDSFEGDSWHSTEWNHNVDYAGKRVAVVGSAAAAVQIVPELAKTVEHLTVLQRSPNWIMPRGRKPYSDARRAWFRRLPLLMRMTQKMQAFMMSFVHEAATLGHKRMDQFEATALKFIHETIPEGPLRDAVTPDSRYGCKRGLVSDGFYPALTQDNVELIPESLAEVTPTGIVTAGGRAVDVDIIIYCTGYRILDFDRIDVRGAQGQSLAETMAPGPEAYAGIAAPGFPNYFFVVGPNGLVLNVSYFKTIERNVSTIVRVLAEKQAAAAKSIAIQPAISRDYNDWMRSEFGKFSWGHSSCNSYYITADGQVPFLYPGPFKDWVTMHDGISLDDFVVES